MRPASVSVTPPPIRLHPEPQAKPTSPFADMSASELDGWCRAAQRHIEAPTPTVMRGVLTCDSAEDVIQNFGNKPPARPNIRPVYLPQQIENLVHALALLIFKYCGDYTARRFMRDPQGATILETVRAQAPSLLATALERFRLVGPRGVEYETIIAKLDALDAEASSNDT